MYVLQASRTNLFLSQRGLVGSRSRLVQGALDSESSFGEDMGVYHGCPHIAVTEQFLDRADVIALFQQAGSERMSERMTTSVFVDP